MHHYEITIIGGGIAGLGVAEACAARGVNALVLEAHKTAQATSDNTLRIIHGGFRYLQQANIARVIRSLRDQSSIARDFPEATFVVNGGIVSVEQARVLMAPAQTQEPEQQSALALPGLDGVMIGRAAYHDPWLLRDLDALLFGESAQRPHDRASIIGPLADYFDTQRLLGVPPKTMARHWHGLFHGQPGARHWRRAMSEGFRPYNSVHAVEQI
jgi:tRNA-dihydrouridine synthase